MKEKRYFRYGIAISFILVSLCMSYYYFDKKNSNMKDDTILTDLNDAIDLDASKKQTVKENTREEITEAFEEKVDGNKEIIEYEGFVLLQSLNENFIFDIRYATENNFTNQVIYENDLCVLRKETAEKLVEANKILNEKGYKIKVYDGYRSLNNQRKLWEVVSNPKYVADPNNGGSIHNRGGAVDITIVDFNDKEVVMPSKYDEFTIRAHRDSKMSEEAKRNMDILTDAMTKVGFKTISTEWWHFEDGNKDKYKIEDIDMERFVR